MLKPVPRQTMIGNSELQRAVTLHFLSDATRRAILRLGGLDMWIEGTNWHDVEESLRRQSMPSDEIRSWIGDRRAGLHSVTQRMRSAAIEDADEWHISGFDDAGTWTYSPRSGLLPIDYYILRPVLINPIERDAVCRGVLTARLVHDGHSRFDARWAADKLPWCHEQDSEPFALDVEEYGWDNHAFDLAPLISERKRRTSDPWQSVTMRHLPPGQAGELLVAGGTPCYLPATCYRLVEALMKSPTRSLSLVEVMEQVWNTRPAAIKETDLQKVRTCSSRSSTAIIEARIGVTVKRADDSSTHRISLYHFDAPE